MTVNSNDTLTNCPGQGEFSISFAEYAFQKNETNGRAGATKSSRKLAVHFGCDLLAYSSSVTLQQANNAVVLMDLKTKTACKRHLLDSIEVECHPPRTVWHCLA
jgi:hypothetical protein